MRPEEIQDIKKIVDEEKCPYCGSEGYIMAKGLQYATGSDVTIEGSMVSIDLSEDGGMDWTIDLSHIWCENCKYILFDRSEELLKTVANWIVESKKDLKLEGEEVYYQPQWDEELWNKAGLSSFQVYRSKEKAQEDFPTLEIDKFSGDDIEDHTYID